LSKGFGFPKPFSIFGDSILSPVFLILTHLYENRT